MSYQVNRVTYSTTGSKSLTLGGAPKMLRVTLGSRFGTTETYPHFSQFCFDGTNMFCMTVIDDKTENFTNKLSHWAKSNGISTEVINATNFVFSGNTIIFTVNATSASYQWLIETDY